MKSIIIFLLMFFCISNIFSQSNEIVKEKEGSDKVYAESIFRTTHIINSHCVEQLYAKSLNFVIFHRFGNVRNGVDNLFGLDNANIRLALEYAINNQFTIGIGRSDYEKTYDGFVKMKLIGQSKGGEYSFPLAMTYIASMEIFSSPWKNPSRENYFSSRITYVHQMLIARKFNKKLSLQMMLTVLHKNLVKTATQSNDIPAIGIGGRYKLTDKFAVTFEYYKTFRFSSIPQEYHNPLSIGLDIETWGHVFQFSLSNSPFMQEGNFIYGTNNDDFFTANIHLGFNITRIFYF